MAAAVAVETITATRRSASRPVRLLAAVVDFGGGGGGGFAPGPDLDDEIPF